MGNIRRKLGYMKAVKGYKQPTNFIFFDTETHMNEDSNGVFTFPLKLGVMTYVQIDKDGVIKRRKQEVFYSIDEFMDSLESILRPKSKYYVFAHNVGFDVRVLDLVQQFHDRDYQTRPPIINERVFIWDVRKFNTKIVFLDTANLGVQSVRQLGKDLGFDKLDVDFDTVSTDDLITYCIRDVDILEKFVLDYIKFLRDNDMGSFRSTLAGQSLYAYRKRFMNNPPFIHTHEETLELERLGYHGGRVECFHIGKLPDKPYYYCDINSMYPFAMSGDCLPKRLKGYDKDVPVRYMGVRLKRSYVIADVTITTKVPIYPIIQDNKLIFPIGTFRTVLHHKELERAYNDGSIDVVHKCAVYERGILFDDYVNFLYGRKKQYTIEGNRSYRLMTKLFLNSLYGKFGQQQPYRDLVGETNEDVVWRLPVVDMENNRHYQEICWFGEIYREYKEGETPLSIPSIAGAITANARYLLWSYIEIAGIDNVYYCDTDSIITNDVGYEHLQPYLNDYDLGMLKVEDKGTRLEIFGNKDYIFEDSIKVKGVPKSAKEIALGTWEYLQFQGFTTWLNDGAVGSPTGRTLTKARKSRYNKGVVGATGNVQPFRLGVGD